MHKKGDKKPKILFFSLSLKSDFNLKKKKKNSENKQC